MNENTTNVTIAISILVFFFILFDFTDRTSQRHHELELAKISAMSVCARD